MTQQWTAENCIESWLLASEELALLENKYHRLAFAISLKFFQHEGRFPNNEDSIPTVVIDNIATQLDCSVEKLKNYNWEGRTARRFQPEIREYLGYRKASNQLGSELVDWLVNDILPQGHTLPQCKELLYQYLKTRKIEPFKPTRLERYIRSAYQQFEKKFFARVVSKLSNTTRISLDKLLHQPDSDNVDEKHLLEPSHIKLRHLKKDATGVSLKSIEAEILKLKRVREINLPTNLFPDISRKVTLKYYSRIMAESPSEIMAHHEITRYATLTAFCYIRSQKITDTLTEQLVQLIRKIHFNAEQNLKKEIFKHVKKVNGKFDILFLLASSALESPEGAIQDVIYPKVDKQTLQDVIADLTHKGKWYDYRIKTKMHSSYIHYHRRAITPILKNLEFRANNPAHKSLLNAIALIKKHLNSSDKYFPETEDVPIEGVISTNWKSLVLEQHTSKTKKKGTVIKIHRANYEIAVLESLRKQVRCKSIWVVGAYTYRNPEEDLPKDFKEKREDYYKQLDLPLDNNEFITTLQQTMHQHLKQLNDNILKNNKVKILDKDGGHIKISPSDPQPEPKNLEALQHEIIQRWSTVSLIDILKEVDLSTHFSKNFHTTATRQRIDALTLRKRLLLSLYAIGSNIGLKRMSAANQDVSYQDLLYVKKRFISDVHVRNAITEVVNAILDIRDPAIWGTATTGCACDSTKVSAWDQNLLTEWHARYRGRGVMIYWHVDTKSTCIYSQLKSCSSSEVASMIEGVLRHCTKMQMDKGYVDTHGQSVIGFAFSHLLHFDLLPRLKGIHKQKLYLPYKNSADKYNNLKHILKKQINWELIREQYDEIVKYTVALKTGTAEPEVIFKRFSKDNYSHPVYQALSELGKAVKTIFLCRYLNSEALRIEINESLNVVERLNSVMGFIFYGKLGEISTNKQADQELAVLCLHLLQVCLVYINTLMIQEVLSDPSWLNKLTLEDKRALTPLIHIHINPYGLFPLDMNKRIIIKLTKEESTDDKATHVSQKESKTTPEVFA